jgi:Flp pilus assembly protein TadG
MSFVYNSILRPLGRAGVTSLEFALVALVLLPLLISLFDLARYLFTIQSMQTLMTDVGRYAMVQPTNSERCSPFQDWISNTTVVIPPLLPDVPNDQICSSFLNLYTGLGVNQVQVTVTYPFSFISPWLTGLDSTLIQSTTYSY